MRIGIITFHWATNYGAVLQAYALQTYLQNRGHDVKIINYIPFTCEKKIIKCIITKRPWQLLSNLRNIFKERRFEKFRRKALNLSMKYSTFEALKNNPPECDIYICGSDQVWNPFFTRAGEGKLTLSYFLDFGGIKVKRIAYATSFGCKEYPVDLIEKILPPLSQFDGISVRENSGEKIVRSAGIKDALLVPDPTLLLKADDYNQLNLPEMVLDKKYCFFYTVHSDKGFVSALRQYLIQKRGHYIIDTNTPFYSTVSIEGWLGLIRSAKIVVTNSYHGMIFSVLFKRSFIITLREGPHSGMNDRVFTLAKRLGLEGRVINVLDEEKINAALENQINWEAVERKIKDLHESAELFFDRNIDNF